MALLNDMIATFREANSNKSNFRNNPSQEIMVEEVQRFDVVVTSFAIKQIKLYHESYFLVDVSLTKHS